MATASIEIVLCAVVVVLTILSFWMESRRRAADQQNVQRLNQLQAQIDRLDKNIDSLQNDLKLLFPSIELHRN